MHKGAISRSRLSTVLITISSIPSTFLLAASHKMMLRVRTWAAICIPWCASTSVAKLLSEHHVTENLENEWTDPVTHRDPLWAFFHHQMTTNGEIAESVTK